MKITLKQLRVFVEIAKKQSISEGAKACFLSQSAASISLSQLEKTLGISLFSRHKKKLQLNSDGKELFIKAVSILEKSEEFESFNIPEEKLKGSITVGANYVISNYVLPKLIAQFQKEYPNIEISILSSCLENTFENVDNESCDIGFVEGRIPFHKLKTEEIIIKKSFLKIISSLEHPLAKKEVVTIDDIFKYKWIQYPDVLSTRDIYIKKFNKESSIMKRWVGDFEESQDITMSDIIFTDNGDIIKEGMEDIMKVDFSLPSIEAVKNYIANSDYLATLSENCINKFEENKRFKVIEVHGVTMTRNHRILLKDNKHHTKIVTLFSNWLRKKSY